MIKRNEKHSRVSWKKREKGEKIMKYKRRRGAIGRETSDTELCANGGFKRTQNWKMKASLHLFPGSDAFYSSACVSGESRHRCDSSQVAEAGPWISGDRGSTDGRRISHLEVHLRKACLHNGRRIRGEHQLRQRMVSMFNSFSGSEMEGVAILVGGGEIEDVLIIYISCFITCLLFKWR